jgi:deoxyribodipyrimidine photo-lyase
MMPEDLRRDFNSREELVEYCRRIFPEAAAIDGHISPVRGGRAAALEWMEQLEPERYGYTRNFLSGAVSRLSPYIRHGVLTLTEVRRAALAKVRRPLAAAKFIVELAWRDYWQRLYQRWGDGIWVDREDYKTGLRPGDYAPQLPPDITSAATGLACIDAFATELHQTGYLHNHARMWLAAYVVHWRRVQWQAGARWFLTHLLDGDPASNNLSWQWVASTFSHKPYFFNKDNLEKYTDVRFCPACPSRQSCPFDASYSELSERLFSLK